MQGRAMQGRAQWRGATAALLVAAGLLFAACGGSGGGATPTAAAGAAGAATASADAGTGYRRDANAALAALATAALSVEGVMAKADPQSAAWRASLAAALDAVSKVHTQVQALNAPAAYAQAQQALLDVTADFDQAAQLIRGAVEPPNADALDQAGALLQAGVTKVATVRAMLAAG